jgi:hypothetical protein
MDLIEYLNSYTKGKKQTKKVKKGRNKIPRKARGYGQRGSKYNGDRNQSFRDNIDKQLLALLTTLTKQTQPKIDLSNPEALNPFVERDRQKYSMSKVKDKEEEFTMDEKKGIRKAITLPEKDPIKIKETKNLIFNVSQDLDMRVKEVVDTQQKLLTELNEVSVMSPELAKEFRTENLKLKEEVLSETYRIQGLLNDAEDLNDYRDIVKKQNKMIDDTLKGFVEIDNNLSERQVGETERLSQGTEIMKRELVNMIEQVGGRAEELEEIQEELEDRRFDVAMLEGELKQEREQKKLGVLGVLGMEALSNVKDRVAKKEKKKFEKDLEKQESKLRSQYVKRMEKTAEKHLRQGEESKEREMKDIREENIGLVDRQGRLVKGMRDLQGIVRQQQTTGTLQGLREGILSGVKEKVVEQKFQEEGETMEQLIKIRKQTDEDLEQLRQTISEQSRDLLEEQEFSMGVEDENIDLKLRLERSEATEIQLRARLEELENNIDIDAELELQRVLSGEGGFEPERVEIETLGSDI